MFQSLSIKAKVNVSLAIVFLIILLSTLTAIYKSETALVSEVVEKNTLDTADAYFDSINILMLSGAMANRSTLQNKILSDDDVIEARIIRSDKINQFYGEGSADSKPKDNLDFRALRGEQIIEEINDKLGHRLTVITPMKSQADYKGTNCLGCHPGTEGEILGAVRVTYSYENLNKVVASNLFSVGATEVVLFIAGLLLISVMLTKTVVNPITGIAGTIKKIHRESDLRLRTQTNSQDEIGDISESLNQMLEKFHASLTQVSNTTIQLSTSSESIDEIAEQTNKAVHQQQTQTETVASAMEEMEAATENVHRSADATVVASNTALQKSDEGNQITQEAMDAIDALKSNIDSALKVINQLDSQSEQVGTVLEVIQKIAEQTNLLALNAAIEAARAGESGRGFSVVADEVRTLASRTSDSTEEINAIISTLQNDAKHAVSVMEQAHSSAEFGVSKVQQATTALADIATEVQQINKMNHQVAVSVSEQTNMAKSVDDSVHHIAKSAASTSDRAEELNKVAHELNGLAGQLKNMVSKFSL